MILRFGLHGADLLGADLLGADPLERARHAARVLTEDHRLGTWPLDHVGWFEAGQDVERIVSELARPWQRFPSIVVAEELGCEVWITRLNIAEGRDIEIFSLPGGQRLDRAHLAFRAPNVQSLEHVARSFDVKVHAARDGLKLAYLAPSLEIVASD